MPFRILETANLSHLVDSLTLRKISWGVGISDARDFQLRTTDISCYLPSSMVHGEFILDRRT